MDKVYILLPVHDRKLVTQKFINCLKLQTYQNYHLVLIDDGSIDETDEMVKNEIQSLTILKGTGQWWWAGSLQQGYKWLKINQINPKDIVLIINDDTTFEVDFLEKAVKILESQNKTLLLSQCYSLQTNQFLDAGIHVDWKKLTFKNESNFKKINCFSTRGLFLRVEDFLGIGGFYPNLLPHYGSDYEFTIRAYNKGWNLMTTSELKLWLDETTTGTHQVSSTELLKPLLIEIFSKKSTLNPIHLTTFIVLSCPLLWKPFNIIRIWVRFLRIFFYKNFHQV